MDCLQGANSPDFLKESIMNKATYSYDEQASDFDARTGFSEQVAKQIAESVLKYGRIRRGDRLLEIGAGTGEISNWLCRSDLHYIGVDSFDLMLDEFRSRLRYGKTQLC